MSAIYDDLRHEDASQDGGNVGETSEEPQQTHSINGTKEQQRWSGLDGAKEVMRKCGGGDNAGRQSVDSSGSRLSSIRKRFSSRSGSGRRPVKRIVFLGACEVGKTAIVSRIRGVEYFSNVYEPTMIDYYPHSMALKTTEPEHVELVDVTGAMEKEYEPVREKAMKKADSFVVVYSVKDRNSFTRAETFLDQIESLVGGKTLENGFRVLLVANQVDEDDDELQEYDIMPAKRVVTKDEGWQLAEKFDIKDYLEMSALTGIGVDSIPRRLAAIFQQVAERHQTVKKSKSLKEVMVNFGRKLARSSSVSAPDSKRVAQNGSRDDLPPRTPVTLPRGTEKGEASPQKATLDKLAPGERSRSLSWIATFRRSFRSRTKTQKRSDGAGDKEEVNDSPPRRHLPVQAGQSRRPSLVTAV